MDSGSSDAWIPPVAFHFRVEFQWDDNSRASASFSEVDGLCQELLFEERKMDSDNTPGYPKGVKIQDITLKRSLEPIDEVISKWVQDAFNVFYSGWIAPCTLIVSLLDESGNATAAWEFQRVIPFRWKLGTLSASESKLAVESLTLRFSRLTRTK